jgi:hypothetical protein
MLRRHKRLRARSLERRLIVVLDSALAFRAKNRQGLRHKPRNNAV